MALDLAEPKAKVFLCTFKLNSAFHVPLNSQPMRPGADAKMTEAYIHFSKVEKENGLELVTRTRIANPKGNACKDAKDRVNQSALSTSPVAACNREVLVEKMDTGKA